MKNNSFKNLMGRLVVCGVIAALAFGGGFSLDAFGKPSSSRSSGFSSSRSSSSSSKPSVSKPSTSSPSKPSPSTASPSRSTGFGKSEAVTSTSTTKPISTGTVSSKPAVAAGAAAVTATSTTPKLSAADSALKAKAEKSGTAFSTKAAAASDYRTKNASKYSSTYKSEPATRPEHVPATTSVAGKSYDVTYNSNQGGYGYWNGGGPGLGTWMMYDAMSDAVMLSALMSKDNYHYPTTTVVSTNGTVTTTQSRAPSQTSSAMGLFFGVLCAGLFIVVLVSIFRS